MPIPGNMLSIVSGLQRQKTLAERPKFPELVYLWQDVIRIFHLNVGI